MRSAAVLLLVALFGCAPAQPSAVSVPATAPEMVPAAAPPAPPVPPSEPKGTLFLAKTVLAGPAQTPQKDWGVYVLDGVIREVGPAEDLRARFPMPQRSIVTLEGTILPGLIDAHGHLYGLGLSLDIVNLVGTTSYDEVIGRVKERASRAAAGEWVLGRGWDQNDWTVKEFPTAAALDAAIPDRPVALERVDGHATLANSAAMRAAGVTAATKDPDGGRIVRDANGNPTGVFIDAASSLIDRAVPPPTPAQRKARVLAAAEAIAANGLTEMHDAGIDGLTLAAVQELIDEKRFPIRVYAMLADNDALVNTWFNSGPLVGYGGRLTVRSVKLYADGALGSRGAALLAPYSDDPGNSGLMVATPEHLAERVVQGRRAGFQINIHAIGDRGVRNAIDAYAGAGVTDGDRNRIEHLQVIAPSDVQRLVMHGIIASMQPTHATSDMYWAEARVGPERVKGAYAWQALRAAGVRLALGSDFPVEDVNPFFGIYAAVTRQDQKGWPAGGWYPSQRLSLSEAIRGFTLDAAYAAFEEKSRGTIEPGKLADFTIVDGDLFAMPESDLYKAKVRYTIVGGEIVFGAK